MRDALEISALWTHVFPSKSKKNEEVYDDAVRRLVAAVNAGRE